jgi:hypothetical protein
MSMTAAAAAPRWCVSGNWNGFFGLFTNGTALGIGNSVGVALGYAIVAAICLGFYFQAQSAPAMVLDEAVTEPGE